MQRTAQKHLSSIRQRATYCARHKDWKGLESYLRSDAFLTSLAALSPGDRMWALRALFDAQARCADRMPSIPAPTNSRTSFNVADPVQRQRILSAWAKTGNDKDLALMLGTPLAATKIARWKVVGPIKPKTPRPQSPETASVSAI